MHAKHLKKKKCIIHVIFCSVIGDINEIIPPFKDSEIKAIAIEIFNSYCSLMRENDINLRFNFREAQRHEAIFLSSSIDLGFHFNDKR